MRKRSEYKTNKIDESKRVKKRKKRLLVTASTFPRWADDTEPRFVLDISKALTKYFDVTVLVPACPDAKDREILEGVKVVRYHYFPIHKLETLCYPGAIVPRIKEKKSRALLVPFLVFSLWLNVWTRMDRYDYVHAHWIIPQGIVQSLFQKRYIVTGHGTDVVSLNQGVMKKIKKWTLGRASAVTVVSTYLEGVVKEICPDAKTTVLSMGCWTERFSRSFRQENYFLQGDKKVILFVGRLAEKKGVRYLIEAMRDIDAKLVIVGKGPEEEDLKRQSKGQSDKITFLGPKTHDELKTIYASADVFAAPSVTAKDGDQEGFGLVILEAMASGLPVVASRSGGILDLISDGENGLLAEEKNPKDIAEKINRLLADDEFYETMQKRALQTAKQYDYAEIGRKYAKVIEGKSLE